jgi:HSP20 family molecular chaperone IbpA
MNMNQRNLGTRESKNDVHATPIVPAVDIVEDAAGITVKADLPGVAREDLSIDVDGDTLTIAGAMALHDASQLRSVHAEVRTPQYKRSFVLSRDLDTENVTATFAHGVLTLRLVKREQARPRRIEVRS